MDRFMSLARPIAGALVNEVFVLIVGFSFMRPDDAGVPLWIRVGFWTGVALMSVGVLLSPWAARLPRPVRWLGLVGYLTSAAVLIVCFVATGRVGDLLGLAAVFAGLAAFAFVMNRVVERQRAKAMAEREAAIARGEAPLHHPALDWRDPTATW